MKDNWAGSKIVNGSNYYPKDSKEVSGESSAPVHCKLAYEKSGRCCLRRAAESKEAGDLLKLPV